MARNFEKPPRFWHLAFELGSNTTSVTICLGNRTTIAQKKKSRKTTLPFPRTLPTQKHCTNHSVGSNEQSCSTRAASRCAPQRLWRQPLPCSSRSASKGALAKEELDTETENHKQSSTQVMATSCWLPEWRIGFGLPLQRTLANLRCCCCC